jgi:hypothetical protein
MKTCVVCETPVGTRRTEEVRKHSGRGLCASCWNRAYYSGTLDEYPRTYRRGDELLTEWDSLRSHLVFEEFPRAVNISREAWLSVYRRGVKKGDPRAVGR